jgi:hypothetical protein
MTLNAAVVPAIPSEATQGWANLGDERHQDPV